MRQSDIELHHNKKREVICMHIYCKEVGKRITARRKELGLKQWQVSEMPNCLTNICPIMKIQN